jgi:UDP-N-acetylglucosamine 4,6-dehydratase
MRIIDLAQALAPDVPHTYSGIREGEKLHELMIGIEDARHTLEFDDHYLIMPEIFRDNPETLTKFLSGRPGAPLPEDFSYGSNTNTQWLTIEELQKIIQPFLND